MKVFRTDPESFHGCSEELSCSREPNADAIARSRYNPYEVTAEELEIAKQLIIAARRRNNLHVSLEDLGIKIDPSEAGDMGIFIPFQVSAASSSSPRLPSGAMSEIVIQ